MEPKLGNASEGKEKLNIKVLVADDTPSVLRVTTLFLERMGYTVETAKSGQELLDKLAQAEEGEYGLIITDNTMLVNEKPAMTGIEALKRIRKDDRFEKFKRVPVIVSTADTPEEVGRVIEAEGGVYGSKPFTMEEFQETVQKAMERKGA